MVVVQLFAVRDENTLGSDSLEILLLLGRMVLVGGTVGGSGINGSVIDGTVRARVGLERSTSTGSGGGLSVFVDAAGAGGLGVRILFVWRCFFYPLCRCLSSRIVCRARLRRWRVGKNESEDGD